MKFEGQFCVAGDMNKQPLKTVLFEGLFLCHTSSHFDGLRPELASTEGRVEWEALAAKHSETPHLCGQYFSSNLPPLERNPKPAKSKRNGPRNRPVRCCQTQPLYYLESYKRLL